MSDLSDLGRLLELIQADAADPGALRFSSFGDDFIPAPRTGQPLVLAALSGDDTAIGTNLADFVAGGEGDDTIYGRGGDDRLLGGAGNDRIEGGGGADIVEGGAGDDRLLGGKGDDHIVGGAGDDTILGGGGDDVIAAGTGRNVVTGNAGTDTLVLSGLLSDYTFSELGNGRLRIDAKDGSSSTVANRIELVADAAGHTADAGEAGRVTLQLLHASDFEGNTSTVEFAPNFATIVDTLDDQYATTLILSSGDNFIPSPFSNVAATQDAAVQAALSAALNATMSQLTGDTYQSLVAEPGRIDIAMLNAIGVQAATVGNHDLDFGQEQLLRDYAAFDNGTPDTSDDTWLGALFPYLSANAELGPDSVLRQAYDADGIQPGEDATGVLAPFAVIEENGERFGVIGATTQLLASISSTKGDPNNPDDDLTVPPGRDDMPALAAAIQPIVDAMLEEGVNKIIVASHLQDLRNEMALAPLLSGVDIIIGGGSNTRLADEGDRLREGEEAQGPYPIVTAGADGTAMVIVNTDGNYKYVGRLVVDFDQGGNLIIPSIDEAVSGAYATDTQGVLDVTGAADLDAAIAGSQKGSMVKALADVVGSAIETTLGSLVFGDQAVDLNGDRQPGVRTEETNLGDLTADANLWYARQMGHDDVLVSIKNGGGIRASIPNDDGKVSALEIQTALAFNNNLSLVTLTPEQLLQALNHGVAASTYDADGNPTNAQGRFPQIGGVKFSFDPALAEGERVQDVWLEGVGPGGADVKIVEDGALTWAASDYADGIRVVTLSFLLDGGDGYPFADLIAADPAFANVESLYDPQMIVADGAAQFTFVGTEQDALAEYLAAEYPVDADPSNDFAMADTPAIEDTRIINLGIPGVLDTDLPL